MLAPLPAPERQRLSRLRGIAGDLPLCRASVRAAFEAGEFELAYQPILSADTLAPLACEALLRWHHPTRGVQLPNHFLPVIARAQLSPEVGDWVMDTACAQLIDWERQGLPTLRLAVNVTAAELLSPNFAPRLERRIANANLAPGRLTLEIPQDVLHDRGNIASLLHRVSALGVGIELDDFGCGRSLLRRLPALSIRGFKLDRRFVAGLEHEGSARDEVRALARLAAELGLKWTAEGVEHESEFDAVRELGATQVQGPLFCAPVTPPAFDRFLHAQAGMAARVVPAVGGSGRA